MQITSAPHAQGESSAVAPALTDNVLTSPELQTVDEVIAAPQDSDKSNITMVIEEMHEVAAEPQGAPVVEEMHEVAAEPQGAPADDPCSEDGANAPVETTVHSAEPENPEHLMVLPSNVEQQELQEDQVMRDPGDTQRNSDHQPSLDTPSAAGVRPATPPQIDLPVTPFHTPTTRHRAPDSEESRRFMSSIFHTDKFLASAEDTPRQDHPRASHHSHEMTAEQIELMWAGRNRINLPVEQTVQ
jgi:hypothetical protein